MEISLKGSFIGYIENGALGIILFKLHFCQFSHDLHYFATSGNISDQ